jgi:hypothetical protein
MGAVPPATGDGQYVDGMPWSAQNSSLSTVSKGCLSGVTGWLYMTKYGLARSSSAPPRTSQAMRHMGSTVSTPPAVMTSGLVVLLIMMLNCFGYASPASMPSGQAPDITKSMLGSASHSRAATLTSSSLPRRRCPVSRS